jgi:hypothetical protein
MAASVGTADRPQKVDEMSKHVRFVTPLESWENEGEPPSPKANVEERLGWASFLARFYPDARTHDYASLAAYAEYRRGFTPPVPVPDMNEFAERSRP